MGQPGAGAGSQPAPRHGDRNYWGRRGWQKRRGRWQVRGCPLPSVVADTLLIERIAARRGNDSLEKVV